MENDDKFRRSLYLPKALNDAIVKQAKADRRSVNSEIVYLLALALKPKVLAELKN